jgi:hypothetical protein
MVEFPPALHVPFNQPKALVHIKDSHVFICPNICTKRTSALLEETHEGTVHGEAWQVERDG